MGELDGNTAVITAVHGDASELDRSHVTVKREKSTVDVLGTKTAFESLIPRGALTRPEDTATFAPFLAPATPVASTAWNWSLTAARCSSEPRAGSVAASARHERRLRKPRLINRKEHIS